MIQVNLKEAEAHLAELIEEAAGGQEVIIAADGCIVRLVAVPQRQSESYALAEPDIWTPEQEAELLHAVEFFERVAESSWA